MNHTKPSSFPRTDLAIERLTNLGNCSLPGVIQEETEQNNIKISSLKISDASSAEQLGKARGTYITIEPTSFQSVPTDFDQEVEIIAEQITALLPKPLHSAFVVGLGNAQITPDALGPQVIQNTIATRHLPQETLAEIGLKGLSSVSAMAPGVLGQTGIESAEIIRALCIQNKPDVVIVIDALASQSLSRLGCTIQLSDTGIAPGSGVLNMRKELNRETLGVPVLAIGVPTIVDLQTIAAEYSGQKVESSSQIPNMMVTPREIDLLIEHAAKIIGFSINKALQPLLRVADIAGLV